MTTYSDLQQRFNTIPDKAIRDALFDLARGGSTTWGNLPTPSAGNAGARIWCSDYPGPQGGCMLISNGVRWRPESQQHCLMNYHNSDTGLVVASGAAEALFGVARLIKGGMLKPGDLLRFTAQIQQAAASDAGARTFRIRSAATESGLLAGSVAGVYASNSTTTTSHCLDKSQTIITNTAGKSSTSGQPGSTTAIAGLQDIAFSDLSADSYMQFSAQNASSQALTIYSSTLFVEFGS